MFRRPSLTIIVLTRRLLARADFTGGRAPRLANLWQEPRPALDDLPSFVEAGLSLGGKPGRQVVVLCGDYWTQTQLMNARTIAHLNPDELARALAFEVETLSGLGALDSVIGQVEVGSTREERAFWIVQAPAADRAAIEAIVRRAGARLLGLGHPGGLPAPLALDGEGKSWQRVELWPGLVVCLHQEAGQPVRVHLINADPDQGRWHDEEESWRAQHAAVERREMMLTSGEVVTFGSDGQPVMQQSPEEALTPWLTAWAAQLLTDPKKVPLARPSPKPMTGAARAGVAAAVALAAAALCYGHSFAFQRLALEPAQAEAKRLRDPQRLLTEMDQRITALEKEQGELTRQVDAQRQVNTTLLAQRQRVARLLAALADHQPADLLVQKIEGDAGLPVIHGVCLRENQANQLAARLAKALPGDWAVKETRFKAREQLSDGGPFAFQLRLRMVGPEGAAAAVDAKPAVRRGAP